MNHPSPPALVVMKFERGDSTKIVTFEYRSTSMVVYTDCNNNVCYLKGWNEVVRMTKNWRKAGWKLISRTGG